MEELLLQHDGKYAAAEQNCGEIGYVNWTMQPADHSIVISGVTVRFPYEPYDVQVEFMRNTINALEAGENALLESPTGTGKVYPWTILSLRL